MSAIHAVTVPKWGLSMEKGRLTAWNRAVGEAVAAGDEICDIETEKISGGVESPGGGVLRRRLAAEGDDLPVGALLAIVADAAVPEAEIDAAVAAFAAPVTAAAAAGPAAPEPETLQVGGRRLRFLRMGAGGPPVLLLHGFGGDLAGWLFVHEALAGGRTVYALDLPGHGGSTKDVGAGTLEELADAAAGFLDAVGAPRAHLVGHSMGGAVALALARAGRARSLSLLAPAGLGREVNGAYIDGFVGAGNRAALKPLLAQLFADEALVTRQLVEEVLKYKRLEGVEPALRKLAANLFAGGVQARGFREALPSLGVPILAVWGTADRIVPPAHAEGLGPAVRVERLPGVGHMPHLEAAPALLRLLDGFIGREA